MQCGGRLASIFVFLALLVMAPAQAQQARVEPEKAIQFVHQLGTKVVSVLGASGLSDEQLREQIEMVIRDNIDIETIGRSSLGSAWQRASDAQRKDFMEQFSIWATQTYAERLGANRGGSMTVVGARATAGDAFVRTRVARADGRASTLDFRVREDAGRMRIVDAEVDGISMDTLQRDEFASVVRRQGLDFLIANLRTQVQSPKPLATN